MFSLALVCGCGSSESDDPVGSASAESSSAVTAEPATTTDDDAEASSSTTPVDDDAEPTSESSSSAADEPASSSSSSSDGAAMPGTAGTYEACTVDDDCAAPDEVCLAVHPLAKPQCRPPCAPDGWCDPDPSVGNIMFGACADDGYCMVFCTDPTVPCVAPFVCAQFEGAQDGSCSPP